MIAVTNATIYYAFTVFHVLFMVLFIHYLFECSVIIL